MTSAMPVLDPDRGEVLLQPDTFEALVQFTERGAHAEGEPHLRKQVKLLRCAAVIDEAGQVHPSLTATLAAIRLPGACRMELTQRGATADVWVSPTVAALLLPWADDPMCKLTRLPASLLPAGLARLVDLFTRSRPALAGPLPLHRLLAEPVRRHWRLSAEWTLSDGQTGSDGVEVVDTDGALWLVDPTSGGDPVAWPSDPTAVWRMIVRLVARHRTAA